MANNNYLLKELGTGGTVKDYQHAARIFLDSNYRLAPKNAFLFHVAFDVDPTLSLQGQEQILEAGLLVKQTGLPQFTAEYKPYNAYNRPNIVQTKIKYNPIEIVFYDDNADVVRDFWFNYYNFYYRDSDTNLVAQNAPHKYQERMTNRWGYTLRVDSATPKVLRSIRIYVLHQQRFTEYLLVNPVITRWGGSELDTGQAAGVVESRMTVDYEAVIFSSGTLVEDYVPTFFNLHYDRTASDITPGAVKTIGAGNTGTSLPDAIRNGYTKIVTATGDIAGAAREARNTIQQAEQFKKDIRAFQSSAKDFKNFGKYILQGTNPFSQIRVPDWTNLTRGIARTIDNAGRAVNSAQGVFGVKSTGQTLSTPRLDRGSGTITSNQSNVSTAPPAPTYWTSSVGGAMPPLPTSPGSASPPATTEQLSAAAAADPGNIEAALIKSGYVSGKQLETAKSLFTNSKNLQPDQAVQDLTAQLDAAGGEQQQLFIEQYLSSTDDSGQSSTDTGSDW